MQVLWPNGVAYPMIASPVPSFSWNKEEPTHGSHRSQKVSSTKCRRVKAGNGCQEEAMQKSSSAVLGVRSELNTVVFLHVSWLPFTEVQCTVFML